ncbi:serine/threonine-protein kinase [Naumannella cuiyingiana]|uniref:non-specific serine/threonine protein kinase n=1 Tax=Naumannella cuiyingiana TaxID=1347891 RepID=A0A7Z0D799_9ACTN|nr:serine/threonine-protein kinase [Naumannella cuiyingiana]NYI70066.1 serine/threonine-protein kinase [Naumannella cuiyingiana]
MELVAGRFELYDRIGDGGMGRVWRAFDRKSGRWIAAKQLTHSDAAMVLRFVREQALRIDHPHVLAPTGWAADDDRVVLAMDLVAGGSLETLLGDHGALPDAYAAVLLDQLLAALEAIHAHGVVHRDIKPANLLLDATGTGMPRLRVSDFGVSVIMDEPRLTHTSMSIGTLGYMAPEQARGAEPEPRHDLHAAGVVGKRMITGQPSRGLPENWPSPLWPFLARLTDPDPRRRPSSAADARAELRRTGLLTGGTPWLAEPDPPEVFDQLAALPRRTLIDSPPTPTPVDPGTGRRIAAPARAQRPARNSGRGARKTALIVLTAGAFLGAIALVVAILVILLG